jgi:uncharacterized protein DUF1835
MLNVTNGDSAVAKLRAAGAEGDLLAWQDALHEGPAQGGAAERARFIADRGWAPFDDALAELTARDERLQRAIDTGEEIVLWFETDLYDVLQLAQIADRITDARIVLVGQDEFRGVAQLEPDEIRAARPEPFDPEPYRRLWRAFTAPDPRALNDLAGLPPVVRDAAHRLSQEFAWTTDGLNRSQRALLQAGGTKEEAFVAAQRQEERPFMGDAIAFDYVEGRAQPRPALATTRRPNGSSSSARKRASAPSAATSRASRAAR